MQIFPQPLISGAKDSVQKQTFYIAAVSGFVSIVSTLFQPMPILDSTVVAGVQEKDTLSEFRVAPVGVLGVPDIEFIGDASDAVYEACLEVVGNNSNNTRKILIGKLEHFDSSGTLATGNQIEGKGYSRSSIAGSGQFNMFCKLGIPLEVGSVLSTGDRIVPSLRSTSASGALRIELSKLIIYKYPKAS
tara:strand:- start:27 stop:593 length:567 start_codon:yes stop_codon:yes gene_type:complete